MKIIKSLNFFNCYSIFQCVKPMFYLSKIFGLVPYSLPIKDGVLKKTTLFDYIIAVLSGALNLYLFYNNTSTNYLIPPSSSIIFDFCSRAALHVIILLLIITLFSNMINRSKIWKIFQLINECDEEVTNNRILRKISSFKILNFSYYQSELQ